ncbi:MAG TPA: M1 family aminopeptidase [Thermoanaerobaculia bacterium]|nr:M1 family aminopeptidase [Thermoanaerobaculia bacterium]
MLSEIIRFEWRHHSRQPAFLAAAALFFLLGFALAATAFGPDNVAVNSSFLVTESFGFLSLFSLFAVAIFAANAVLRDDDHRMREIVDATPVPRARFLAARFAGAFLATLTVTTCSALGNLAGSFAPWLDPKRVAAFDLRPYLAAFGTITIPNVLFATALLFAVAILTRNSIATYAASVVAYVLYLVCSALTNSPLMAASKAGGGGGTIFALLDPFGLTAFFDVTRNWTAAAKNAWFVPLTGTLLANRLICIGGAIVLWALIQKRRPAAPRVRKPKPQRDVRHWGAAPQSAYLSATGMELRALVTKTGLLLFVAWVALAATQIYSDVLDGEYGSTLYPATSLVTGALQQPLWLVSMIVIIYFGAEIFWREQQFRVASLVDSTPVSGGVMIAAKATAMAALVSALTLGAIATGVAVQLSRGWFAFQPLVYLSLFYFIGLPVLLYGVASLLIHALSPGKYAGMIFFLVFIMFTRRASVLGLAHPLWHYGVVPPVRYTEMNGFGAYAAPFHRFLLHWSAYAVLFAVLAAMLWRRVGMPLRERVRVLRWNGAVVALLVVIVASGAWIFAKTDRDDTLAFKADYEKKYKRFESLPRPRVKAIDVNVDFDPAARAYRVAARYALENETARPIDTLLLTMRREARVASVSLSGARVAENDPRFATWRFTFQPPLAPHARTELRFDFSSKDDDDIVVDTGSLLMSDLRFPTVGYRKSYEIYDPAERKKRGLPETSAPVDAGDVGIDADAAEWIDFTATVTTSRDQIAIAPGTLEASGTRGDRRWFRYRAEQPILNRFGFVSGRYQVAKRQHGPVSIEVYYDARHATNVARMLDSAEAALDVMSASFGAYPQRELRIVEVPSYAPFAGFALPQTILLREDRAFLTDARDANRPDLIARRVAHEVAHQWFGYRFIGANAPGGLVVTESLPKLGELLTVERLHDREHVRRFLDIERERYLSGRTREEHGEVPLVRVEQQPYLYYSKGGVVLWAIRDLIGADAMNAAIRNAMQTSRPSGTDLARELRKSGGALVDQWMSDIVLYDLRLDSAVGRARNDGKWDVTLRVNAGKLRADSRGNETRIPFAESIEISVDDASQKFALHDGVNELTMIVERPPVFATIDPWVTRLDRNPSDDGKRVERVSGGGR